MTSPLSRGGELRSVTDQPAQMETLQRHRAAAFRER